MDRSNTRNMRGGKGVPMNLRWARFWLKRAAEFDDQKVIESLRELDAKNGEKP